MTLWLAVIGMGIITYVIRLSLLGIWERVELTAVTHRALKFVPIAVLSAILVPELVMPGGTINLSLGNGRLIAGLIAIAVAWKSQDAFWPVVVGMIVLWLLP
ncbi:MAG: AzlD domain-containing protein [Anaerolineales bacterium]|nr:AzlD domain-containing protein [Anaerolineales bacterium]